MSGRRVIAGRVIGAGLCLALMTSMASCMSASHRLAKKLENRYTVPGPGAGWHPVDPGGADHAWYNNELSASIYADSNCGPRYAEVRTEDLATELTAGLRGITTTLDETRLLGGREGLLRVHSGRLDGVPVTVALGVVNRGACTYDFALIAPPETFQSGWEAYEHVLAGFSPM